MEDKISKEYEIQKKLEEVLESLEKPLISQNRKNRILYEISNKLSEIPKESIYNLLIAKIQELARQIVLPISTRIFIKEKLLMMLPQPRLFSFRILMKRAAYIMIFVLIFTGIFSFMKQPEPVFAAPATFIESIKGDIEIVRGGRILVPSPNFKLKTQDLVRTFRDSSISIHFLDDSVARLSENTELRIDRLFVNPLDKTETIVELYLKQGRLWAKVVNLINDFSKFQVKSGNTITTAKKKAAFDVNMQEKGKTKITALQNTIDISVATKKKKVIGTTLVNGFAVELKGAVSAVPKPKKIVEESWIAENIKEDKNYIEKLVERDKETRQENAKTTVSPMQTLSEATKTVLGIPNIEKEKAKLKAAEVRLIQAENILTTSPDEAKKLLRDFHDLVIEVSGRIKQLEAEDRQKALELRNAMEEKLRTYKKQFTLFMPTDPLYLLKEAVTETDIMVASDSAEKTEKKLEQAGEKLMEATALTESGNADLAKNTLQEYQEQVSEVVSDVKSLEDSQKEEAVFTLLKKKTDHLKLFEALAAEVKFKAPPVLPLGEIRGIALKEMLEEVKAVKEESLTKVGEAVLETAQSENSQPPVAILEKLEEIKQLEVNGQLVLDVKASDLLNMPTSPAASAVTESSIVESPPPPSPAEEPKEPAFNEIKSDSFSGVTVITIEAVPSEQEAEKN